MNWEHSRGFWGTLLERINESPSHRAMQSRLMSLLMLTTRQQCLFVCSRTFRKVCRRLCYMHFRCQPTSQLQSTQVSDYRSENWIGRFVSGYAKMEGPSQRDSFLGFTTGFKEVTSEFESSHCVIHRGMVASWKMLPEFNACRVWLKLSTTLRYMSCSHRAHTFCLIKRKQGGFLKL